MRHVRGAGVAKRLSHVHRHRPITPDFALAQPFVEQRLACLLAVLLTKPDRSPANQIGHATCAEFNQ